MDPHTPQNAGHSPGTLPRTQPPMEGSATELFLEYRATGDARALTAVFDMTAPELLGLAGHLSASLADAEDLLQQCFLVAIQKAKRFDERRTVLPWLAGILIKEAKTQRRKKARRIDPERLPDRTQSDASSRALGGEIRNHVELALGRIPPKYGSVLRAYLLEGSDAPTIAANMGRAPGTVRVQLHRGFDLLRRALPSGLSLGILATLMPRGLAEVRHVVHAHAAAQGPLLAAAGSGGLALSSWPVLPTFAMNTKFITAAALAVLVGVGALWKPWIPATSAPEASQPPTPAGSVEASADALGPPAPSILITPQGEEVPPSTQAVRSQALPSDPAYTSQEVAIEWTGAILRGQITAQLAPEPTTFDIRVRVGGDSNLETQLTRLGPGPFELDLAEFAQGSALDQLSVLVIVSAPGYGSASAFADLQPHQIRATDTAGQESATQSKLQSPEVRRATAIYLAELQPALIERTLLGRLVGPDEQPIEDGWVAFVPTERGPAFWTQGGEHTRTAANGRFSLPLKHKRPGSVVAIAEGYGSVQAAIPESLEPRIDIGTLPLPEGGIIRGIALQDGQPLPEGSKVRATLTPKPMPTAFAQRHVQIEGERVALSEAHAVVGPGGSFELAGLEPGMVYHLTALPKGEFASFLNHGEGGQSVRCPAYHVQLDWSLVRLQLAVTTAGEPARRARVRGLRPAQGEWAGYPIILRGGWTQPASGNAEGLVHVLLATGSRTHLEVSATDAVTRMIEVDAQRLPASGVLRVDLEAETTSATMIVRFEGAPPETIAGAWALFYLFDQEKGLQQLDPATVRDGVAKIKGLEAGLAEMHLQLYSPGFGSYDSLPFVPTDARKFRFAPLQAGEVREHVLPLEHGGRIELEVTGLRAASGASGLASPSFELVDASGEVLTPEAWFRGEHDKAVKGAWTQDGPGLLGRWLSPGTYTIRQTSESYLADEVHAIVRPGQITPIHFGLRAKH